MMSKEQITSVAIGRFDGMHMAHQTLFSNLTKHGAIIVIDTGNSNLTPKYHREEFSLYPIFYYELERIKNLSGKTFIKNLVKEFPLLRKIVVGFDFYFGKDRSCSIEELKKYFHGEVVIVNEVSINDIAVHSKAIRRLLKKGKVISASALLGRKYKIKGFQIKGQGLGAKEFVPTINISTLGFLLPAQGVYATKTLINGISYFSITFVGNRYSTDGKFSVETHLLNQNVVSSSELIEIKFVKKIRDNMKFKTFEKLKKQIDKDLVFVQNYFNITNN